LISRVIHNNRLVVIGHKNVAAAFDHHGDTASRYLSIFSAFPRPGLV
jgi:hypothetical protein